MLCLKCCTPFTPDKPKTSDGRGLHEECFNSWFNTSATTQFTNLIRRSSHSFDHNPYPQNASFFHGAFKKYSADLAGSSYILKMREAEKGPELPEVEYLCNQIGATLGLPVAEFYFIDTEGDSIFVTKNFISPKNPTDLQHIYHSLINKSHNCHNLIQAVAEKTKRPYDVNILIQTILYDALIGNHDRHGRNLAFIITSDKAIISPIYDNISYLALEQGNMLRADFNPRGAISTDATNHPTMQDYVIEFKRLGYEEQVIKFYKKINLSELLLIVQNSFCSDLMKDAMMRLISKRFKELENELNS